MENSTQTQPGWTKIKQRGTPADREPAVMEKFLKELDIKIETLANKNQVLLEMCHDFKSINNAVLGPEEEDQSKAAPPAKQEQPSMLIGIMHHKLELLEKEVEAFNRLNGFLSQQINRYRSFIGSHG